MAPRRPKQQRAPRTGRTTTRGAISRIAQAHDGNLDIMVKMGWGMDKMLGVKNKARAREGLPPLEKIDDPVILAAVEERKRTQQANTRRYQAKMRKLAYQGGVEEARKLKWTKGRLQNLKDWVAKGKPGVWFEGKSYDNEDEEAGSSEEDLDTERGNDDDIAMSEVEESNYSESVDQEEEDEAGDNIQVGGHSRDYIDAWIGDSVLMGMVPAATQPTRPRMKRGKRTSTPSLESYGQPCSTNHSGIYSSQNTPVFRSYTDDEQPEQIINPFSGAFDMDRRSSGLPLSNNYILGPPFAKTPQSMPPEVPAYQQLRSQPRHLSSTYDTGYGSSPSQGRLPNGLPYTGSFPGPPSQADYTGGYPRISAASNSLPLHKQLEVAELELQARQVEAGAWEQSQALGAQVSREGVKLAHRTVTSLKGSLKLQESQQASFPLY